MTEPLVGGLFGLAEPTAEGEGFPPDRSTPEFLREPALLTVNARSAVRLLVEAVRPSTVWLPSYLCAALVDAVSGVALKWYPVGRDLQAESLSWLGRTGPSDLVVVIDYFGFRQTELVAAAGSRGAFVLEDASQALLTAAAGEGADAVVFSPRKFVGAVDGGILRLRSPGTGFAELEAPPGEWWSMALEASQRRAAFDRGSPDRGWYGIFRTVEASAPVGPYSMSPLSEDVLTTGVDYELVAGRRRSNYGVLAKRLRALALYPELPAGVVPLGFPIRLARRDRVRRSLFAQQIFAPTHWPIDGIVPAAFVASHDLAASILTLPCDQRYDSGDMERLADAVDAALSETRFVAEGHA